MEAWVGPAVVAALIAAFISAIGWFVSTRQTMVLDRYRRLEKRRDLQIALRAEIRSELANLRSNDFDAVLAVTVARLNEEAERRVVLLQPAPNVVFEALVADIHLLPATVIDPVVLYMRQCAVVANLVATLGSHGFRDFSRDQALALVTDYFEMKKEQLRMAERATEALDRSIRRPI